MSAQWEEVTEFTWRLKLEEGYLYRYGSKSVVFVPDRSDRIADALGNIADALVRLKDLFEETTFELSGGDARAFRNSNIG
jgi:hypothetical protein